MSEDVTVGVQSRISAFEALRSNKPAHPSASKSAPSLLDAPLSPTARHYFPIAPSASSSSAKSVSSRSSSPSSSTLGRKTSSIDLKDWVVDDGPLPYAQRQKRQVSARPVANGSGPNFRHVSDSVVRQTVTQAPPLIHLESPPNPKSAPPLPPRKASYSSLKSASAANLSSSPLLRSPNAYVPPLPPQQLRKKSDSLTVDHSYPPLTKLGISIPSRGTSAGHVPASSISSFHSVSLSSDGGTDPTTPGSLSNFVATYPIDHEDSNAHHHREPDSVSLEESFENVSAYSIVSPSVSSVSNDWAEFVRRPEPPKLPQRPRPAVSVSPSSSSSTPTIPIQVPYAVRPQSKPNPPPPPPRTRPPSSNRSSLTSTITSAASDRSSIISTATSRTSLSSVRPIFPSKPMPVSAQLPQLVRPTPIPLSARRRYETVFLANVLAQRRGVANARDRTLSPSPGRKTRQAAGWRGLSVDLITNPEENAQGTPTSQSEFPDEEIGLEERLDGHIVAVIWACSRLERKRLQEIWNECDAGVMGSLDKDGFVKGMWRIDEELRKAQLSFRSPSTRQPKRLNSFFR